MPVAVDTQERFLEEVFTLLHISEETINVVCQRILVPADQNVEGLHGSHLELGHEVLVAHLTEGIKMPVVRIQVSHHAELRRFYRKRPLLELSYVFCFCHGIR